MSASKDYPPNYKANKFVNMGFKKCIYKTKTSSGKNLVGRGATDFINKAHLADHKMSTYNFEMFGHGTANEVKEEDSKAYSNTKEFYNYSNQFDQKIDDYKDPGKTSEVYVDIGTSSSSSTIITPYESNKKKNTSSNSSNDVVIDLSGNNNNNDDGIIVDIKKK